MAMTTEQAEHYTLKLQGYSRSELVTMLVQTEREHQARGDELESIKLGNAEVDALLAQTTEERDRARGAFRGMSDTCATTIEERDTARTERDALADALRAFVEKAHPRAAVVGGATHDYIVERAVWDAAHAALAKVQR